MKITKESVTPKKAMEWLKLNVANRPISARQVGHYAKAMECGQWKLNGDCIRFNGSGNLIDGQHRLTACIQAGKSFDTYVVTGLEHDAFDTIDQGKKRDISDVFARQGFKNYAVLSSAVRWLWWSNGGRQAKLKMRPDEANDLLDKNSGMHAAVDTAIKIARQQRGLISASLLSFLIYKTSKIDESAVGWWTSVVTGAGLKAGTPGLLLHKRLVDNIASVAKLRHETVCALSIKAWNCYRTTDRLKCLKFEDREEFPRFAK
jgi:hypothetical protein